MRVGCITYACNQGLGILAKSFYDAGVITDFLIVDRQSLKDKRPTQFDWYPNSKSLSINEVTASRVEWFLKDLDTLLVFETPFDWNILSQCKRLGVLTVLMPMYECMPTTLPIPPDRIICPSLLDQQYYTNSEFIPVPVDNVAWRHRDKAQVFVHNSGHGGLKGRNGTAELVEATKYIKSGVQIIIRAQSSLGFGCHPLPNVHYRFGTVPREELYGEGDVFVFPEKFNGLSLPLQEAYATGMAVMCGNRFPMNTWLPQSPMIPIASYRRNSISGRCHEFDEAIIEPKAIAATIDAWYGMPISDLSLAGKEWAEANSWEKLKPAYMKALTP